MNAIMMLRFETDDSLAVRRIRRDFQKTIIQKRHFFAWEQCLVISGLQLRLPVQVG
jgi:hypothetical protein